MTDFISNYLTFSVIVIAIGIAFSGGILLLLRPLILWYYKIYTVVSELKENNALLREIRDELRIINIQTPTSTHQAKEDYSKYMPREPLCHSSFQD